MDVMTFVILHMFHYSKQMVCRKYECEPTSNLRSSSKNYLIKFGEVQNFHHDDEHFLYFKERIPVHRMYFKLLIYLTTLYELQSLGSLR
jgi:hypothetical protein